MSSNYELFLMRAAAILKYYFLFASISKFSVRLRGGCIRSSRVRVKEAIRDRTRIKAMKSDVLIFILSFL